MDNTPIWQTLIGSILAGGAVTAIITYFVNVLTKKRENYYEIYKHKTSVISQSLPVYGKLGSYYSELSDHLSNLKDVERTIFCACKLLHYEDLIFEKYGTIQLDNLEAEEIITNLVLSVPIQVNGQLINLVRKCLRT